MMVVRALTAATTAVMMVVRTFTAAAVMMVVVMLLASFGLGFVRIHFLVIQINCLCSFTLTNNLAKLTNLFDNSHFARLYLNNFSEKTCFIRKNVLVFS